MLLILVVEVVDDDYDYDYDYGGELILLDYLVVEILCIISGGCLIWDFVEGIMNGILFEDYMDVV